MVKSAETTMNDVDLVLYLIEPFEKIKDSDKAILERLKNVTTTWYFLVINKIDTINKEELFKVISSYREVYDFKEIIPISALKQQNKEDLLKYIEKYLPEDLNISLKIWLQTSRKSR